MDINKFTQKAQEALFSAESAARELNHQAIEPAHLLLALLQQTESTVPAVVTQIAGSTQALLHELRNDLDKRPKVHGAAQTGLSPATVSALDAAQRFAKGMGDEFTSTEHILLGLTETNENKRLESYGITRDAILKALRAVRGSQSVTSQNPEATFQALEKYGRDLTALARAWRNDVHGAERISFVPSTDPVTSPSVLIEYRSLDSRGPRVWHLVHGPDKSQTIVREVRNGLGQPQTSQTLAEKLDAVDVSLDDAHQLYSMHIRAHSGTAPFMRSQDLTFLASSHTLPLSPTVPLEVH
mgnify:CR=1 FL=1